MEVETIKIKHKDGFAIINKDDFDPKKHEAYEQKKPVARPKKSKVKTDGN